MAGHAVRQRRWVAHCSHAAAVNGLLATVACGDPSASASTEQIVARIAARSCVPVETQWEPKGDARLTPVAESADIQPTLGMASSVDGSLYVFDGSLQRISKVSPDGRGAFLVGREGQGPGEFSRLRREIMWPVGATAEWLAYHADTLVAFDGRRLQRFSITGALIDGVAFAAAPVTGNGPYFVNRLRSRIGEVLIGLEQQGNHSKLGRRFDLWRLRPGSAAEPVFGVALPGMPRTPEGGFYRGPNEATPLWDAMDDCVVVSDGASATIMVGSIALGRVDTLPLALPDRKVGEAAELVTILPRVGTRGSMPPPSRAKRILRLVIAPDHWIWIEPVQPPGLTGIEVIRLNPVTQHQRVDTVPAFPLVFGRPGEYWSAKRTPVGTLGLVRVSWASPPDSATRSGH